MMDRKRLKTRYELLEKAAQEGITDMIATPHAFSPHFHVSRNEIEGQIELLKDVVRAARIPVNFIRAKKFGCVRILSKNC